MADDPNNQPWIQTLPGLMTAAATLITAVSGLVIGVHQISSTVQTPESPAPAATPVASPATAAPAAVSPEAVPAEATTTTEAVVDPKDKPERPKGGKKKEKE